MTCRVPGCIALADASDARVRGVYTVGVCAAHQSLPDDDLRALLARKIGLCAPLMLVSDRIEREPVRLDLFGEEASA